MRHELEDSADFGRRAFEKQAWLVGAAPPLHKQHERLAKGSLISIGIGRGGIVALAFSLAAEDSTARVEEAPAASQQKGWGQHGRPVGAKPLAPPFRRAEIAFVPTSTGNKSWPECLNGTR
jgi:hypothetical protein